MLSTKPAVVSFEREKSCKSFTNIVLEDKIMICLTNQPTNP